MLPSEYVKMGWTQNTLARDCYGAPIHPDSEKAMSWCMLGAITTSMYNAADTQLLLNRIYDIINGKSLAYYNDNPKRTREEVIAVLKQAEQELDGVMLPSEYLEKEWTQEDSARNHNGAPVA